MTRTHSGQWRPGLVLLAAGVFAVAASNSATAGGAGDIQKVVCFVSILPQSFFVERIGGEHVEVHVMVGPGQTPHTYEPTSRQLTDLANSQIYFSIGVAFEHTLLPRIERNFRSVRIVDTSAGIRLRRADHDGSAAHAAAEEPIAASKSSTRDERDSGTFDPHVWLSPALAITIAANISNALGKIDPNHAVLYTDNYEGLKNELMEIDAEIAQTLSPYKGRELLVYHPAYGYFTDSYGLIQVAIEERGGPPGPKHLAEVIDRAKAQGVRAVFVQPQMSATYAETVAKSIGAKIIELDPLAANYDENLLKISRQIAASFQMK